MRTIFAIMKKEGLRWSAMPVFYILCALIIFGIGFYTWFFKGKALNDANVISASLRALYWALAIAIPLLATGTVLQERRFKTLETLFAKPVSFTQFVLGKLAAINVVFLSFFMLTIFYHVSIERIETIPYAYLFSVYLFLFLTGNVYALISMAVASFGKFYWKSYLWSYLIVIALHCILTFLGDVGVGEIQNFFHFVGLLSQFEYFLKGGFAVSTITYLCSMIWVGFFLIIYKLSRDNV